MSSGSGLLPVGLEGVLDLVGAAVLLEGVLDLLGAAVLVELFVVGTIGQSVSTALPSTFAAPPNDVICRHYPFSAAQEAPAAEASCDRAKPNEKSLLSNGA